MDQELIQILIGPRQCGKSSLLFKLGEKYNEVTFDDLQTRKLAQDDPALFLTLNSAPLIIDEVQYSPNIFPELKKIIVVSLGGTQKLLSNQCRQVPISELTKFLIEMM